MQADALVVVQLAVGLSTLVALVATPFAAHYAVRRELNGTKIAVQQTSEDIAEVKCDMKDLKEGQTKALLAIGRLETDARNTRAWVDGLENRFDRHLNGHE